jgi:DNA repair protein RadC
MNTQTVIVLQDQAEPMELLRKLFGRSAQRVYAEHRRSLARILAESRSTYGRGWNELRTVQALTELALLEAKSQETRANSPAAVREFLRLRFAGQAHESFAVVFIDCHQGVIAVEEMFRGTLTQTSVFPREVVKRSLHYNACSVILSHCHPSGMLEPSAADRSITGNLKQALELVDVRVQDHILVAGNRTMSFAEAGLI